MARIYISYGITKSASTFAWQLIKRIAITGGLPIATLSIKSKGRNTPEDYIDVLSGENLALIRADVGDAPVVLKTHGGVTPAVIRLVAGGQAIVFASYRDLRDVALSLLDHGARSRQRGIADFAQLHTIRDTLPMLQSQVADCFEKWVASCKPLLIPYDEICFDTRKTISRIAVHIGVNVDVESIFSEFSTNKQAIGQFNKGERQRFRREMTDEDASLIFNMFQKYYVKYLPTETALRPARLSAAADPASAHLTHNPMAAPPLARLGPVPRGAASGASAVVRVWANKQISFWQAVPLDRPSTGEKLAFLNRTESRVALLAIQGGTVTVADKPDRPAPTGNTLTRIALYRSYLEQVVRKSCPELSCELLLDVDDGGQLDQSVPVFAFQKPHGNTKLLIPDIDFLKFSFYEDKDNGMKVNDDRPFEEKRCSAIFVGSTTGQMLTTEAATNLASPRLRAAAYFRDNPSVTFSLPNIVQYDNANTKKILENAGFGGTLISWKEQLSHKFLISMDGNGATCSRVIRALKSNSVLLKYDSPHELYYFADMQPWVHYIPIRDHSDVLGVIEAEQRQPGTFRHIADAGREFANTYLTRDGTMQYTAALLQLYEACFADPIPKPAHSPMPGGDREQRPVAGSGTVPTAGAAPGPRGGTTVLVLGMHRSGTSSLAGCLQGVGAQFGPKLLAPDRWNPKGYFEHAEIVALHGRILATLGLSWDDPGALAENWVDDPRVEPFRERLAAIVRRDFGGIPLWGLKDPRLCRLLPLWLRVLRDLDVTATAVLVVRHPADVSASLNRRSGMDREKAMALWLSYVVAAERNSRGLSRTLVLYEDLLRDWKGELEHLRSALGVDFEAVSHPPADDLLSGFVDSGLRHHHETVALCSDDPTTKSADAVYDAMLRWRRHGASPADVCEQAVQSFRKAKFAIQPVCDAEVEVTSRAAELKGVRMNRINQYYDDTVIERRVAAGEHRLLVGGGWSDIGRLQFDFLRKYGLSPSSILLDMGCGCLRGGIHFVDFLSPGNYFGIDISQSLLDAGYDVELRSLGLCDKLPRTNLVCNGEFDLSSLPDSFDFVIAQSLFTYLPASHVRLCLSRLRGKMKSGGAFFATFFIVPDDHPIGSPFEHPHGIRSTDDRNPCHYRFAQLVRLSEELRWAPVLIGDWGHPVGQQMVMFQPIDGPRPSSGVQTRTSTSMSATEARPSPRGTQAKPPAIAPVGSPLVPPAVGASRQGDATGRTGPTPAIRWFHSFEFDDGEVVTGRKTLQTLRNEAQRTFSEAVAGKSVLDIGAWDGYFSYEAERRGASDVLATDHFCWSGRGWGSKAGFDYVHAKLGSRIRSLDIDVFDLDPERLGTFDVCLFLGVLYHLKNPLGGLEKVSRMTRQFAVIETAVTELNNPKPVLRFYPGAELNSDASNFFAPNHACLEGMLREVGFKRFKFTPQQHPAGVITARTVVHAWK